MADPRSPDIGAAIRVGPEGGSPPGVPRWVKVIGLVALAVALLLVVALLAGGGHGPQQHASAGDTGGHAPSNLTLSLG